MIKVKTLHINNFKMFNKIDINFSEGISVIVGGNGTGKTTILEIIFNALTGNKEYFLADESFTSLYIEFLDNDIKDRIQYVCENNNIKILLNDKEVMIQDVLNKYKIIYLPAESKFKDRKLDGVKLLEKNENSVVLDAKEIEEKLKQFLLNQFFIDLSDMQNGMPKDITGIEKFKKLYNEFFTDKEFASIDVRGFEPIFKQKSTGKLLKIKDLSTGEQQIFYRGGALLQNINENTVVLIDEPEISLHPEWQQRILDFYKNINNDCQYIFATHSPHIVSCCKKEELIALYKDEIGRINVNRDIENPYAMPTDLLLLSIFNLGTIRNQKVEKIIDRYKELSSREKSLNEEELKELQYLKNEIKTQVNPQDDEVKLMDKPADTSELEAILKELGGGSLDA